MKPVNNSSSAFGAAAEKDRILRLLENGFGSDEIADLLGLIGDEYSLAKEELEAIRSELELEAMPEFKPGPKKPEYVEYEAGWYQDLKGNLYKYDGVVWDVVPENKPEELEFLGE